MPLNPTALEAGLLAVASSPPATAANCAQAWANAAIAHASAIVPPSTTVASAGSALATALSAAFATTNAAPLMETAFATFAAAVGAGMAGYVATPPAGTVGFAIEFADPLPSTHADAAENVAQIIDSWMRTGTSTLVAPPGTVVPWS